MSELHENHTEEAPVAGPVILAIMIFIVVATLIYMIWDPVILSGLKR